MEHKEKVMFSRNFLNVKQFSDYTGFSERYVYKLTKDKKIPHYKPGGKLILFQMQDVDNFLFKERIKSKTEIDGEASKFLLTKKINKR